MSFVRFRRLITHIKKWNARERDWCKHDRPKDGREQTRDRNESRRTFALVRYAVLVLVLVALMWMAHLGVTLNVPMSALVVCGVAVLLIDPYLVVVGIADLARAACQLAGLDMPSMSRERRSANAHVRAIAATEMGACVRFVLACRTVHLLASRLRATVGATSPTSHPRLADSLAAAHAVLSAA
jgi:hypothetical protein